MTRWHSPPRAATWNHPSWGSHTTSPWFSTLQGSSRHCVPERHHDLVQPHCEPLSAWVFSQKLCALGIGDTHTMLVLCPMSHFTHVHTMLAYYCVVYCMLRSHVASRSLIKAEVPRVVPLRPSQTQLVRSPELQQGKPVKAGGVLCCKQVDRPMSWTQGLYLLLFLC